MDNSASNDGAAAGPKKSIGRPRKKREWYVIETVPVATAGSEKAEQLAVEASNGEASASESGRTKRQSMVNAMSKLAKPTRRKRTTAKVAPATAGSCDEPVASKAEGEAVQPQAEEPLSLTLAPTPPPTIDQIAETTTSTNSDEPSNSGRATNAVSEPNGGELDEEEEKKVVRELENLEVSKSGAALSPAPISTKSGPEEPTTKLCPNVVEPAAVETEHSTTNEASPLREEQIVSSVEPHPHPSPVAMTLAEMPAVKLEPTSTSHSPPPQHVDAPTDEPTQSESNDLSTPLQQMAIAVVRDVAAEANSTYTAIERNVVLCDEVWDCSAGRQEDDELDRCDCTPTTEELKARKGCGENCIHRQLFIECQKECPSGRRCTNRRFQRRQYSDVEVFDAGLKGFGLRAKSRIANGAFIMEYQGEVVDSEEMCQRIGRYGEDPTHRHHYMMALRNGAVIDATRMGNVSRFINHSCDPNAATQKWTVARQFRVGFFAIRPIEAGEEVTFNYQFERYGKTAQKCLCGTSKCTGYIGAASKDQSSSDDGDETEQSDEDEEEASTVEGDAVSVAGRTPKSVKQSGKGGKARQPRRRNRRSDVAEKDAREMLERKRQMELAEVTELLARGPLRNREHVVAFNRALLWVKHLPSRLRMLEHLLAVEAAPNSESPILRLFVASRGVTLIARWLELPPQETELINAGVDELTLLNNITRLLVRLPIRDKRQVETSNLLRTLDTLAGMEIPSDPVVADVLGSLLQRVSGDDVTGLLSCPSLCLLESLKDNATSLLAKWTQLSLEFKIPKRSSTITVVGVLAGNSSQGKTNCGGSGEGDRDPAPSEDCEIVSATPTFEFGYASLPNQPCQRHESNRRMWVAGDGWHGGYQAPRRPPPPPQRSEPRRAALLRTTAFPVVNTNQSSQSHMVDGDRFKIEPPEEQESQPARDNHPPQQQQKQQLLRPKREESPQYRPIANDRNCSPRRDEGRRYERRESERISRTETYRPHHQHQHDYHHNKHRRYYGGDGGGRESRQTMDRYRRDRPSYDRDRHVYDRHHRPRHRRYDRSGRDSPRRKSYSHSSERREGRRRGRERRKSKSRDERAVKSRRRSPSSSSTSSNSSAGSASSSSGSSPASPKSRSSSSNTRSLSPVVERKAEKAMEVVRTRAGRISRELVEETPQSVPVPVPPPVPPTTPSMLPRDKMLNRRRLSPPSSTQIGMNIPPPALITPPPKAPLTSDLEAEAKKDSGVQVTRPPASLPPYDPSATDGSPGELQGVKKHIADVEEYLHQLKAYHDALEQRTLLQQQVTESVITVAGEQGAHMNTPPPVSAPRAASGLASPAGKFLATFSTVGAPTSSASSPKLKSGRRLEPEVGGTPLSPQPDAKRRRVERGRDEEGTDSSSVKTNSTTPPEDPTMAEGKAAEGAGRVEEIPSTSADVDPKPPIEKPSSPTPVAAVASADAATIWVKYTANNGELYYHCAELRLTKWDLPAGAIVTSPLKIVASATGGDAFPATAMTGCGNCATPMSSTATLETPMSGLEPAALSTPDAAADGSSNMSLSAVTERRRCFKQKVVHFVGEYMGRYRHRFFIGDKAHHDFLRKVTHKVIESPENGSSLEFSESVKESTRRLLDDYIRKFQKAEKDRKRAKTAVETTTNA